MALWLAGRDEAINEQEQADLLAIDALRESGAQELREQGNAYLKQGRSHYKDAVDCYTRAIDMNVGSQVDASVLYANRAQAYLLLGNNKRALDDAQEAIKLNPASVKAYFRGARAALALDMLDEAARLCSEALLKDASNSELTNLQKQVDNRVKDLELKKSRIQKAKNLVLALKQRKAKLGPHLYNEHCGGSRPWQDANSVLHWPVLLIYPEVAITDLIQDFSEFDKFGTHLDTVYGQSGLPWDEQHEYTRERLELYYQANAVVPLQGKRLLKFICPDFAEDVDDLDEDQDSHSCSQKSWIKVNEKLTLRDVIAKPDFVVPGVPVFYVVSSGSSFKTSGKWAAFCSANR